MQQRSVSKSKVKGSSQLVRSGPDVNPMNVLSVSLCFQLELCFLPSNSPLLTQNTQDIPAILHLPTSLPFLSFLLSCLSPCPSPSACFHLVSQVLSNPYKKHVRKLAALKYTESKNRAFFTSTANMCFWEKWRPQQDGKESAKLHLLHSEWCFQPHRWTYEARELQHFQRTESSQSQIKLKTEIDVARSVEDGRGRQVARELGVHGHNSSTGNLITASLGEQEHAVYLIEIVEIINQKCSLKASVHNSQRKHMSVLPQEAVQLLVLISNGFEGGLFEILQTWDFFFLISPNL